MFWGAQGPGLILLGRIAYNVVHEHEGRYPIVLLCLFLGMFAATVFWYIITILYYWTYDPSCMDRARAFLVPKWTFLPFEQIEALPVSGPIRLSHRLLELVCRLGPGYARQGKLRPGHTVACITLACSVVLYWMMMPISAPVPLPTASRLIGVAAWTFAAAVFFFVLVPAWKGLLRHDCSLPVRILPCAASCLLLGIFVVGASQPFAPRVIPVIAYVAILLTVIFWALAGLAFFADHYRIPVLTLTAAFVLVVNQYPAEHVFPVHPVSPTVTTTVLPDPASYVRRLAFAPNGEEEPVIVVTATGGGIHAAAWTATVLRELEQAFGERKFHNHILLMSTVSGGSVAATGYLREYFTAEPFNQHSLDRMQGEAGCSSLQAVAWGMTYPDALRILFPWFFNLFPTLDRFDRGWALEEAVQRNMHDAACFKESQVLDAAVPDPSSLTLDALSRLQGTIPASAPPEDSRRHFPAFTFNTTVVETGDRFLLSNYSVFVDKETREAILPAASFLGVYAREGLVNGPIPHRGGFADLSLLTAARLSASFTFISPAARLPFEMSQGRGQNAFHFVDGGYYDNDGTNSAIEFLKAASPAYSKEHPLHVLLVEIRNTDDVNSEDSPDAYAYQGRLQWDEKKRRWKDSAKGPIRWGPIAQAMAPPTAAIQAGFSSVTRRNRRELELLREAYPGALDVEHLIFDYQQEIHERTLPNGEVKIDTRDSELDQPLSWHLTKRQKIWIDGEGANKGAMDRKPAERENVQKALCWYDSKSRKKRPEMDLRREIEAVRLKAGLPASPPDPCLKFFPPTTPELAKMPASPR